MKTFSAIAGFVLISLAAQAQDLDRPQLRLKPSHRKLDLGHTGKDTPSGIQSQLEKPGRRYSLFPKSSAGKPDMTSAKKTHGLMPVMKPDSSIQFPILAVKPDSTVAFPMPVIKP